MGEPVIEGAVARPAPALRPFVHRYVGYRYEGFAPGLHRGLPSRHLTVIVTIDTPIQIASTPHPESAPGTFAALAGGLHAAPVGIRHDGVQRGVQLELHPGAARVLFGLPAGELGSAVVDLRDVLGPAATELVDRLAAARGWAGRFAALDEVLLRVTRDAAPAPVEVAWAWDRLVASGGTVEVGALARDVGWSRRHLSERFGRELGLTPKAAARVLRFERARGLLERPDRPGLAAVAAACGYYDQAHLNREWRALAGCTPTVWMAEELPSVQDTAAMAG